MLSQATASRSGIATALRWRSETLVNEARIWAASRVRMMKFVFVTERLSKHRDER